MNMKMRARCRACNDVPDGRRVFTPEWAMEFSTFCLFVHVWQSSKTLLFNSQNVFERWLSLQVYSINQLIFEVNQKLLKWFSTPQLLLEHLCRKGAKKKTFFQHQHWLIYIHFIYVCNLVGPFVLKVPIYTENNNITNWEVKCGWASRNILKITRKTIGKEQQMYAKLTNETRIMAWNVEKWSCSLCSSLCKQYLKLKSVLLAVAPLFWWCGFTHYVIQCNINIT